MAARPRAKAKPLVLKVKKSLLAELEALGAASKDLQLVGKWRNGGRFEVGIMRGSKFTPINRYIFELENE